MAGNPKAAKASAPAQTDAAAIADAVVEDVSIVEASATSHLANVRLPHSVDEESEEEPAELAEIELPENAVATHEALKLARQETDPRVRKHKTAKLATHLHKLSQVTKPAALTADQFKRLSGAQNDAAAEMQIEMLGRQYPVIKTYIATLKAEIAALKKK